MPSIASDVGNALGSAADAAATGPLSVVSVIGSIVSKAMDFIPDPAAKLALQSHAMDLQAQAAAEELDAATKQVTAAAASTNGDTSLWKVRAFFCTSITGVIIFNLVGSPLLHALWHLDMSPVPLPTNLLAVFGIIMVGLTAVPQGMAVIRDIMSLPGASSLSFMGAKIGNNS